jgi:hypothetical protein
LITGEVVDDSVGLLSTPGKESALHIVLEVCLENLPVASLSFQLPDIVGFGTGFLIFNLILDFSCFVISLTALKSSRPVFDADAAAGGAVVHYYHRSGAEEGCGKSSPFRDPFVAMTVVTARLRSTSVRFQLIYCSLHSAMKISQTSKAI